MTGRFPPVARMGGKRAYADGVLDILGTWPKRWLLVDADLAIVEFWQAAFAGLLPAVADVIRNAPADGEELWRLWASEPVPVDPVERVARWVGLQKGNFSARPITWMNGNGWINTAGGWSFKRVGGGRPDNSPAISIASTSRRLVAWSGVAGCAAHGRTYGDFVVPPKRAAAMAHAVEGWSGIAGFAALSPLAHKKGFRDRIVREDLADKAGALQPVGEALYLDLSTSSPVVNPGDLVTIDPPYQGTSGYGAALSRERVVELAQEAHERGARVLVHEAEPLAQLLDLGEQWRALRLHRTRAKRQRTWSKQKSEWVTINFEPATAHPGAKARGSKQRLASRREMAPITGPLFDGAPP